MQSSLHIKNDLSMDKSRIYEGLAIMVGLIVLGYMIPMAVKDYRSFDRTVDVKGLCEVEMPADKVIWPITFKVMSDDIIDIYTQTENNVEIVKKFLTDGGIDAAEISVSTPKVSDKFAQEYGANERRFRYLSTSVVTVCTKDVSKVLVLMDQQMELLKKGVAISENAWDNPVQFAFEGLNDIKPEMVEEATRNARLTAEKFAQDSGSRLGKIKNASQGTFSIDDRDSNTPHIKKIRIVTYVTYYLNN